MSGLTDNRMNINFDSREAVLFFELDRREKEEIAHLQKLIKEAQGVEESLQQQYVKLTGTRCP